MPWPLIEVMGRFFEGLHANVWLVGGSALAAFYAEHRRSDDLDLFAGDPASFRAAMIQMQAQKRRGLTLENELRSPSYYHADVDYGGHRFTVDIVLDENLHQKGDYFKVTKDIKVASLITLFAMKTACLVSRCSEKDLYDLAWFEAAGFDFSVRHLIEEGQKIDAGVGIESLLISLKGAILRKEACGFILPDSGETLEAAYRKIIKLRQRLIKNLLAFEEESPLSLDITELAQAIKDQKKLK